MEWTALEHQIGDDPEVLREIVGAYASETRENLERLPQLIASGETAEVRRLAHTVKGAMRLFGASDAADRALELERLAESDLDGADALYAQLESHARPVLRKLERYVETGER